MFSNWRSWKHWLQCGSNNLKVSCICSFGKVLKIRGCRAQEAWIIMHLANGKIAVRAQ